MDHSKKKVYAVKQDEDDRKTFDSKWDKLNSKLKQTQGASYKEPASKFLHLAKLFF